ncbi:uncharacterized protein TRAVEDRAFT_26611 [Trametes versicolor FP-101664 SS1]|uniref:uncharacterized protein n=1 Tax=Trametes versicolor (strain FP-101664) TaxID=717944 RepID=UPI0004621F1B|nr:uncharacterized protein TRAVEDRAFT_26611 [Trametes versicolor FP-101664 SS1]EIW63277.1 hypothetical protein TRAVEDRAFT_26611 [Trametes versicolor FP-101664 SS1]
MFRHHSPVVVQRVHSVGVSRCIARATNPRVLCDASEPLGRMFDRARVPLSPPRSPTLPTHRILSVAQAWPDALDLRRTERQDEPCHWPKERAMIGAPPSD